MSTGSMGVISKPNLTGKWHEVWIEESSWCAFLRACSDVGMYVHARLERVSLLGWMLLCSVHQGLATNKVN